MDPALHPTKDAITDHYPHSHSWKTLLLLLGFMALLTACEMGAQYALKRSWIVPAARKRYAYFGVGVALYLVFGVVFRYTLPVEKFSVVTPLQHIIMVVGTVLLGVFAFGEKLSKMEIAGLVLGITGLGLLLGNHSH